MKLFLNVRVIFKKSTRMYIITVCRVILPQGFNVISSVGTAGEIRQVELNLIPAFIESHGHCADERLHTGCALVVGGTESPAHVLVIEHLHFESEVFFELTATNARQYFA